MPRPREEVNPDSVRVLMEIAAWEHAAEIERSRTIDAKASALLGQATAAIAILSGLLAKPSFFNLSGLPLVTVGLALGAFAAAHLLFLQSVRMRSYQSVDLEQWITKTAVEQEPAELMGVLANYYRKMVKKNADLREVKATAQHWGFVMLSAGVWLVALSLFVGAIMHRN